MPSTARSKLVKSMMDIEQLMKAHDALTRTRKAENLMRKGGRQLGDIAQIVANLVDRPGRGRRAEVDALNRASVVLLSAHLEGYIEELYEEAARILLGNAVRDINALVDQSRKDFSNPRTERVERLFCSIGMSNILDAMRWQRCSNETVRKRLNDYINLRNNIAHGVQVDVSKAKVMQFRAFIEHFADRLDDELSDQIQQLTTRRPW